MEGPLSYLAYQEGPRLSVLHQGGPASQLKVRKTSHFNALQTFPTLPKNLKVVSQVPSSVFTSPPLHFPDGEQQFTTLTLLPAHSKFAFGDGGTYHSGSEAPSACSSAFHVPG